MGPESKRNAETFVVSDEEFKSFLKKHASVPQLVPESNAMMRDSYLILDEYVSWKIANMCACVCGMSACMSIVHVV